MFLWGIMKISQSRILQKMNLSQLSTGTRNLCRERTQHSHTHISKFGRSRCHYGFLSLLGKLAGSAF